MADTKTLYKELVKSFFLAFKRLSLYSVDHPLSKEILNNLYTMFDALLKAEREILLVVGTNVEEIIINEELLDHEVLGVAELYEKFKNFRLDGIGFTQGLTLDELIDFVEALAAASTLYQDKTSSLPALLQEGSEHIKIRKVHYEKIAEGQKIVSKETGEKEGVVGGGLEEELPRGLFTLKEEEKGRQCDVLLEIKNFLAGKSHEIGVDAADVFKELDRDVSKVADAIIESARETGDFEAVIKKFVEWLSQHITLIIEKKRDPSKFIHKLFDSFRKEELGVASAYRDAIIEECADDIKMAMVEEAFALQKTSPKKAIGLAVKILSDPEDQNRLLPKLTQRLIEYGVQEEQAHSFVQQVTTELTKDEEVTISNKKLQKLMRIAERFDQEVDRRVRVATEILTEVNKQLTEEKERSEGIMHLLAEGLVVVDHSGKIVMMNPAAEKLLGREMKDVVGKSLMDGLEKEHLLAVAKESLDGQKKGLITKEIELNSKDETTKKILRASSAVVEDENGKTVGMVSILSDITHEKELEEMKSHFVSMVTHELRTPVVAIQKSLDLVLTRATGELNEDQERFLSISKFNLERLNRLINDLLDMSKLEAGKLILQPTEFDFRDIINEMKSTLTSWINDKEIIFHAELKPEPIMVTADRDRLTQVLLNLVGNALKFTPPKGEVSITLNPLVKKEGVCEQPCLEIIVTDSGIGIDPQDFKRIFNKFEQVSLVSPSGVGGTGLGLPIAKEIINLHGGQIWVESQKGKGSKFTFVIPRTLQSLKKEVQDGAGS